MTRWFSRQAEPEEELSSWSVATDRVTALARGRDRSAAWRMVLSLPLPQAVAVARPVDLARWRLRGSADRELATLLVEADPAMASAVLGSVRAACTRTVSARLAPLANAAFAFGEPVVALVLNEYASPTSPTASGVRIVTLGPEGTRHELYEGPAAHWSVCCMDDATVIARRESGARPRHDTEIVQYTPAGEVVMGNGNGLLDARVLATARGFVIGAKMTPAAYARADGAQLQLELPRHGLRRGDVLAVDAGGDRIAFADRTRILLTDAYLRPLHEHTIRSARPDFYVVALAFTTDALIVADDRGVLHRLEVGGDRIRATDVESPAPRMLSTLSPVPAWNMLVGEGGNENFFFDASSLRRVPAPAFLGDTNRVIGSFTAAPHGRFAVYKGSLFPADEDDPDRWYGAVVHDLGHPLNVLAKPLSALTPGDGATGETSHGLAGHQQDVLALVRRATELRPALVLR